MRAITANHQLKTQPGRLAVLLGSCGAVPGTIVSGTAARLSAAGAVQTIHTAATGSVAPVAKQLRKEPAQHPVRAHRSWVLARSVPGAKRRGFLIPVLRGDCWLPAGMLHEGRAALLIGCVKR